MNYLQLMPTIIVKYLLKSFYGLFCILLKVDPYKVTLASYRSNTLKDNLLYVHEEIKVKYPEFKRYTLLNKLESSLLGKLKYIFHMIKSCYYLATSRYFIIDDYYFPLYVIKPRKGMEIIQLWHSAGAFKKFGLSTVGASFGPSEKYLKHVNIHGNYSKVYVSSNEIIPFFAEAFNMEKSNIYPLGIPRMDYFFDKEVTKKLRSDFETSHPGLIGKKLLLYAPTFRGRSHYQAEFELPFDIRYMEEHLSDEYALLIHLHPYMQSNIAINKNSFVFHIKETYTIQDLLMLSDILITDYSSVFFEFSLLERPMIFFPYDLEEYKQERNFYYSYEDLIPGPLAMDTVTLVRLIQKEHFNIELIKCFRDRFIENQDGHATERIVNHIFKR